jgi:hypothetical protein
MTMNTPKKLINRFQLKFVFNLIIAMFCTACGVLIYLVSFSQRQTAGIYFICAGVWFVLAAIDRTQANRFNKQQAKLTDPPSEDS